MITSAQVDHSTHRIVITGRNLAEGATDRQLQRPHPLVTLDLQPVVEPSSQYGIVVAPLSPTYPDASRLLAVSRGSRVKDSATLSSPSTVSHP